MTTVPAKVRFVCPVCHAASACTLEVPEINWSASDKLSELLSEDDGIVACSACGEHFDAHVQNSPSLCSITLEDYPSVEVSASASISPTRSDEWINTEVPSDTYAIFMDSYHHVGDILAEYGDGGSGILSHSAHVIHRMAFVQQISALEAYLGDTLVIQVLSSAGAMEALLSEDKDLLEMRLPLMVVAKNPEIVSTTIQQHLQGILYHNLAKVAVLYRLALKVNIWPDEEIRKALFVAISRRHDYVHRNGRDKNGNSLAPLARTDVSELLEALRSMVDHIEDQLSATRWHGAP
jgi:hypothetical protein